MADLSGPTLEEPEILRAIDPGAILTGALEQVLQNSEVI